MNAPAPLREAIARLKDAATNEKAHWGLTDSCPPAVDVRVDDLRAILAALPTDAVQPVGGVDREAVARDLDALRYVLNFADEAKQVRTVMSAFTLPERETTAVRLERLYATIKALYATAPTAGSGWQGIESAPKDGVIMGWGEYRERDGFSPAFMRHYDSCGWSVNALPFYPTHWMPLPAAPTVGGE